MEMARNDEPESFSSPDRPTTDRRIILTSSRALLSIPHSRDHFAADTLSNSAKQVMASCVRAGLQPFFHVRGAAGALRTPRSFPITGGIMLTRRRLFHLLYGQRPIDVVFSSAFTNCAIHSSVFSPIHPARSAHHNVRRKSMYCRSTLSSGAVQYLWNVYTTLASKGFRRPKVPVPCAPRERECAEHNLSYLAGQLFVERQAKNSKMSAWENAGSAHSAGITEHGRLIAIAVRQPPPDSDQVVLALVLL